MPTPPFTYAGPSTAAAFTAGVFNLAWDAADAKANETLARVDDAIALATTPPQISGAGVDQTLTLPTAPVLADYDPNAIDARYDATTASVIAMLTDKFAAYMLAYFPPSNYLEYAQEWIRNVFAVGGTGFAPGVEDQIWQRERARLMKDSGRAQEEATALWATKGYPLPPGAANAAVLRVQEDLLGQIADSSRGQAIKAAEIEIENLRFAVTSAIDLRVKGLNAAADYIRTMALAPTVGAQVTAAAASAQADLSRALTQMYSATVTATELPVRLRITDAELRERAEEANLRASSEAQHDRVSAALGASTALGHIAAAAVNGLHAQTGINANESL